MSYQRSPHPLSRFYSISEYYVYHNGDGVEDYGASYSHDPSFCQIIADIVERETGDESYANKICRVLATKLGCDDQLRRKRDRASHWDEDQEFIRILKANPVAWALANIMSNVTEMSYGEDRDSVEIEFAEDMAILDIVKLHRRFEPMVCL